MVFYEVWFERYVVYRLLRVALFPQDLPILSAYELEVFFIFGSVHPTVFCAHSLGPLGFDFAQDKLNKPLCI